MVIHRYDSKVKHRVSRLWSGTITFRGIWLHEFTWRHGRAFAVACRRWLLLFFFFFSLFFLFCFFLFPAARGVREVLLYCCTAVVSFCLFCRHFSFPAQLICKRCTRTARFLWNTCGISYQQSQWLSTGLNCCMFCLPPFCLRSSLHRICCYLLLRPIAPHPLHAKSACKRFRFVCSCVVGVLS